MHRYFGFILVVIAYFMVRRQKNINEKIKSTKTESMFLNLYFVHRLYENYRLFAVRNPLLIFLKKQCHCIVAVDPRLRNVRSKTNNAVLP